jgi:hypothetical protein
MFDVHPHSQELPETLGLGANGHFLGLTQRGETLQGNGDRILLEITPPSAEQPAIDHQSMSENRIAGFDRGSAGEIK